MNSIPDSFVEELRRQVDIVEVVSDYVQLRRAGRSFTGLCPFHNERTPSFSVSPDRQMFHCFGCGAGGTVIRFVMDIEGMPFVEAVAKLAERAGLQLPFELHPSGEERPEKARNERMKEAHDLAAKLYNYILMNTAAGVQALTYLEKRGLSRQTMVDFRMGFAPEGGQTLVAFLGRRGFETELLVECGLAVAMGKRVVDRFRDRVMIPIADGQGNVVSFGGRILKPDGGPKYLNSPESPIFHKGNILFNLHLARKEIRKSRTVVLFEGYMDVISAWQAGIQSGVASMGTALTSDQAQTLKRYADKVIVAYDGDDAGVRATKRAIDIVHEARLASRIAMFPDGQDPDDFIRSRGASAFQKQVLSQSLSDVQFLLEELRRRSSLDSAAARTDFLRQALGILGQRATPIEHETELRKLSQEFQVSVETLKEEFALVAKDPKQRRAVNRQVRPYDAAKKAAPLPKGYVMAGNRLLQAMMVDDASYQFAVERGLDELVLPEQTALLALLYHFRSTHPDGQATAFLDSLEDPGLSSLASSLLIAEMPQFDVEVLEDYLRTIQLHHLEVANTKALQQSAIAQSEGRAEDAETWKRKSDGLLRRLEELKRMQVKGNRA